MMTDELVVEALERLVRDRVAVAVRKALHALLAQVARPRSAPCGHLELGQDDLAELDLDVARLRDLERVGRAPRGSSRSTSAISSARLHVELVARELHAVRVCRRSSRSDAQQQCPGSWRPRARRSGCRWSPTRARPSSPAMRDELAVELGLATRRCRRRCPGPGARGRSRPAPKMPRVRSPSRRRLVGSPARSTCDDAAHARATCR